MSGSNILSVRLPSTLKDKLALLAEQTHRNKSNLAVEAIEHYVDINSWQIDGIEAGIAALDRGQFASHDKVAEWVHSWDKPEPLVKPEP